MREVKVEYRKIIFVHITKFMSCSTAQTDLERNAKTFYSVSLLSLGSFWAIWAQKAIII